MKKSFLLSLVAMTLPLAVWAQSGAKVVSVAANDVIYDGDDTKSGIVVTVGDDVLVENTDYSVVYFRNDERVQTVRDAGKYKGKIAILPASKYWDYQLPANAPDDGYDFTVKKLVVRGGVSLNEGKSVTYTGQEIVGDAKLLDELVGDLSAILKKNAAKGQETERANFLAGLKLIGFDNAKIGPDVNEDGYGVQVSDKGDENWSSNYEYSPASSGSYVALMIKPVELALTQVKTRNYNARPFGITTNAALSYFQLEGIINNDDVSIANLEYVGEDNLTDAGSYPVTATLKGTKKDNYTVKTNENSGHVDFTIGKATLTVKPNKEGNELGKTYGDEDPAWTELFDFTPSYAKSTPLTDEDLKEIVDITRADGEDVKRDVEDAAKVVGYDITIGLTETGDKNFDLEGYDEEDKPQFVINQKSIGEGKTAADGYALVVYEKKVVYNGKPYSGYHEDADDEVKSIADVTCTKEEEEPKELEFGKDYRFYINGGGDEAKDAGKKITIAAIGMGNYTGQIWSDALEIQKAGLTISLKDDVDAATTFKKIADGKGSGNLAQYFNFEGLVESDAEIDEDGNVVKPLEAVLTMQAKNTAARETPYMIRVWNGSKMTEGEITEEAPNDEVLDNYIITKYEQQRYLILPDEALVLDANAESGDEGNVLDGITKYGGLEVSNITVKNIKPIYGEFTAEKWYTMVLPFDITVSDLSAAIGYTIVNIPDESNTDPELAKFKLTMTNIPANTLIAFKVADTETITGEEITFAGKSRKIVEPAKDENEEYEWTTDNAGVMYKGVYSEAYTTKGKPEYWIATDGKFYNGVTEIPVLSGYIEYPTEPTAAKLSLELPDGSTTVIDAITMEPVRSADGWYTVGGVKLNGEPTQKGVYINNGKKVVIK